MLSQKSSRGSRMVARPVLNLLRLAGHDVFEQLVLEEALLRATTSNWFIINDGARSPAIVLGISGNPSELVHLAAAAAARVALIRRFTGGGTVVVGPDTILTSIIMHSPALPHVDCFPAPIMAWTEALYGPVFRPHGDFALRENDYVLGPLKFGGNAQAITGRRWLHHTSLLWDYCQSHMALLRQPRKTPAYRAGRPHGQFVTSLAQHMACGRQALLASLADAATGLPFDVVERRLEDALAEVQRGSSAVNGGNSRRLCGTRFLDIEELLLKEQQQAQEQEQDDFQSKSQAA